MRKYLLIISAVVGVLSPVHLDAECMVLRRPKPTQINGAFCGRVFDRYEHGPVPATRLVLRNRENVVVGEARTDTNGDFRFTALPKGLYHVEAGEPWAIMSGFGNVELKSSDAATCKKLVTVYLGLSYRDCDPGSVCQKWDPPRK